MTTNKSPVSTTPHITTKVVVDCKHDEIWFGKKVLIIGAARQGLALSRFLARKGAHVVLNDKRNGDKIEEACQNVSRSLPGGCVGEVNWVLGGHPPSLLKNIEMVCVSGGVPLDLPIIKQALHQGIPITNDSQIFMECVPCTVIGITGSAGKSTTTTLVGLMAQAALNRESNSKVEAKVWVGGNIGIPLIDQVDQINENDLVILELSSFQLELMTISPHISAILNITPNHLDRHGTMAAYISAKRTILEFQTSEDSAVLGREDPESWALRSYVKGQLVSFGLTKRENNKESTYIDKGKIFLQTKYGLYSLITIKDIPLRGEHNILNVLAAYAIVYAAGLITFDKSEHQINKMADAVQKFSGMPHRLELVRTLNGVSWYNDSIATSPERTIAAIKSFDEPIVLLLGGRDKNLPWEKLSELVRERVDHVIVFGEAADKIIKVLNPSSPRVIPYTLDRCRSLEEAIKKAVNVVHAGDVVLLSPGGTSFDEFIDFEERGERFREWIQRLQ